MVANSTWLGLTVHGWVVWAQVISWPMKCPISAMSKRTISSCWPLVQVTELEGKTARKNWQRNGLRQIGDMMIWRPKHQDIFHHHTYTCFIFDDLNLNIYIYIYEYIYEYIYIIYIWKYPCIIYIYGWSHLSKHQPWLYRPFHLAPVAQGPICLNMWYPSYLLAIDSIDGVNFLHFQTQIVIIGYIYPIHKEKTCISLKPKYPLYSDPYCYHLKYPRSLAMPIENKF